MCSSVPSERYSSAKEMQDDLLFVRAGKSVRRLRTLERRQRVIVRLALVILGAALLALTAFLRERYLLRRLEQVAAESRGHLVQLHLSNGRRAMRDGLWHLATLWFTRALETTRDPDQVEQIRWRIGALHAISPRLVAVGQHKDAVNEVAFSPDGQRFVTASEDGTAQVWATDGGKPSGPPLRHAGAVNDVSFSPDGRLVVTASADGTVGVWDAATGNNALPPLEHGAELWRVAFSPDGAMIVSGGRDGQANVWDAATGRKRFTAPRHETPISWADFSPDSRWLITVGEDNHAIVSSVMDGSPRFAPLVHPEQVRFATFSPDGKRVLTACRDGVARFWNSETGIAETIQVRHLRLNYAAFSHDARKIVTATGDKGEPSEVRVWDATTGQPIGLPVRHDSRVRYAEFSPDDKWLATASHDGLVQLVRVGSGGDGVKLAHGNYVWALAFSPDGRKLLTGGREPVWRLWDLGQHATSQFSVPAYPSTVRAEVTSDNRWLWAGNELGGGLWGLNDAGQLARNSTLPRNFRPICVDPAARRLAVLTSREAVQVLDLATLEPVGPACHHDAKVTDAVFSRDGELLYTGDAAGALRAWNPTAGSMVAGPIPMRILPVWHMALTRDGTRLAICNGNLLSRSGSFALIETAGHHLVRELLNGTNLFTFAAFSPDDSLIAVASGTHPGTAASDVLLLDARTGREALAPLSHPDGVSTLAFSADGRLLATADEEGIARILSIPHRELVSPPLRGQRGLRMIEFSPDGRRVVAASVDGTATIWDVATGEVLIPPLRHDGSLWVARFAHDGQWVLTASEDGEVRIWPLQAASEPIPSLRRRAELNAGVELTTDGSTRALTPEGIMERWNNSRGRPRSPVSARGNDMR